MYNNKQPKDYWIHDPEKCKICQGTGNLDKPGVLEHMLLSLQQTGQIEAQIIDGELKYHLTKKGTDYVENDLLPRLAKREQNEHE